MVNEGAESAILLIADHASNHVPQSIDLGIAAALLETHIAFDIGVAGLARALCIELGCPGILGAMSRLVIDFNREETGGQLIPLASDGHVIPGNAINHDARLERINHYWRPYHDKVAAQIEAQKPRFLISLHSFTPQLATNPDEHRPWEVGILYNEDDRGARFAIPQLQNAGLIVGDQLPYSGKLLNATMNRHAEGNGIAYLGIEMRQDLINQPRWTALLADAVRSCLAGLDPLSRATLLPRL